jgi:hypothetical protein
MMMGIALALTTRYRKQQELAAETAREGFVT